MTPPPPLLYMYMYCTDLAGTSDQRRLHLRRTTSSSAPVPLSTKMPQVHPLTPQTPFEKGSSRGRGTVYEYSCGCPVWGYKIVVKDCGVLCAIKDCNNIVLTQHPSNYFLFLTSRFHILTSLFHIFKSLFHCQPQYRTLLLSHNGRWTQYLVQQRCQK